MQAPGNLTQAQHLAWLHQQPASLTTREALARLLETIRQCSESFEGGALPQAQVLLEESLLQVLVAMRTLDLQPDAGLQRALNRLQQSDTQRAFHIYADRVEVRVQNEVRGGWPLYAQSDYEAVLQLARELNCAITHEEAFQLGLFNTGAVSHAAHSIE